MYMQLFQVDKMYIHVRTLMRMAAEPATAHCSAVITPYRNTNMKVLAVLALTLAAGAASASETQTVYQGVSADGQRVKLTISQGGPEVLIRVDRQAQLPQPHWTALIGTGTAAQR